MNISDFDYHLPKELIAAFPTEDRPSARLLQVDRSTGAISHHIFRDLGQFLRPGDLLVLNNTKVIPARLFGRKPTGGSVETLLLRNTGGNRWEALMRPNRRIKKGAWIIYGSNGSELKAQVLDGARQDSGQRTLEFDEDGALEKIRRMGRIPLPPYLDRPDTDLDREMYQTVFASREGAVASPTAGLHFDRNLLSSLAEQGIEIAYVTLHVSYGTFQPIATDCVEEHRMEEEEYEITEQAAMQINDALQNGRRVIACGTTSVRTLESAVDIQGHVAPGRGKTALFIYPPYRFRIVQGLITNFHLPKSSLLLLVAAFLGPGQGHIAEKLIAVYQSAVRSGYRFYSYGDAMLIHDSRRKGSA